MPDGVDASRLRFDFPDRAYEFLADNIEDIIRLGLLPYSSAFVISCLASLFSSDPRIGYLAYGAAGAIFAVGIHRAIIERSRPEGFVFTVSAQALCYMGLVLLYFLAAKLFVVLRDILSGLLGAGAEQVLAALFIWLFLRLMLVFPHAAVTGEISFRLSWEAMRGNVWRLFAIALRWPPKRVRKGVLGYGLAMILFAGLSSATSGQLKLLLHALGVASVLVIGATLVSFVYKELIADAA